MHEFQVEGPFEVDTARMASGARMVDRSCVKRFWAAIPQYRESRGCYVFAFRTGGGLTPAYVGRATRGFGQECFKDHKLRHYNEALNERTGTPLMFFVVHDKGSGAVDGCIEKLEHHLIQLAVAKNPDLQNVQRLTWRIDGFAHGGAGRPTKAAIALRDCLGI